MSVFRTIPLRLEPSSSVSSSLKPDAVTFAEWKGRSCLLIESSLIPGPEDPSAFSLCWKSVCVGGHWWWMATLSTQRVGSWDLPLGYTYTERREKNCRSRIWTASWEEVKSMRWYPSCTRGLTWCWWHQDDLRCSVSIGWECWNGYKTYSLSQWDIFSCRSTSRRACECRWRYLR